eukprot:6179088-Amphidinium_carterae.1
MDSNGYALTLLVMSSFDAPWKHMYGGVWCGRRFEKLHLLVNAFSIAFEARDRLSSLRPFSSSEGFTLVNIVSARLCPSSVFLTRPRSNASSSHKRMDVDSGVHC